MTMSVTETLTTVELDDASLVAAARGGDRDAFIEMYRRWFPVVRRAAQASTSDRREALDATQEAFASVFLAIQRGGGPTDSPVAYVIRSAQNAVHDGHRRRRSRPSEIPVVGDDLEDVADASDEFAGIVEMNSAMSAAFSMLPPRQREAIWAVDIEGLRARELVTRFGMSANSIAALTKRARENLRDRYIAEVIGPDTDLCVWSLSHLDQYDDGTMLLKERRVIEFHLDRCDECAQRSAVLGIGINAPVTAASALALVLAGTDNPFGVGGRWGHLPAGSARRWRLVVAAAVVGGVTAFGLLAAAGVWSDDRGTVAVDAVAEDPADADAAATAAPVDAEAPASVASGPTTDAPSAASADASPTVQASWPLVEQPHVDVGSKIMLEVRPVVYVDRLAPWFVESMRANPSTASTDTGSPGATVAAGNATATEPGAGAVDDLVGAVASSPAADTGVDVTAGTDSGTDVRDNGDGDRAAESDADRDNGTGNDNRDPGKRGDGNG